MQMSISIIFPQTTHYEMVLSCSSGEATNCAQVTPTDGFHITATNFKDLERGKCCELRSFTLTE
jgi:hypothetical protein